MTDNKKFKPIKLIKIAVFFSFFAAIQPAIFALTPEEFYTKFDPQLYISKDIQFRKPGPDKHGFFFKYEYTAEARGYLVMGYIPEAIEKYNDQKDTSREYAYALALNGYYEPAMLRLDDEHIQKPSDTGPYYYAGWIYAFSGYGDLAKDFWKIAQGDGFAAGMAANSLNMTRNIGALSYAGVDREFVRELDYPESDGVVVLTVYPGPEPFRSDLKSQDIIMEADNVKIEGIQELTEIINKKNAGDYLNLLIWRNGGKQSLKVRVNSIDSISGLPEIKGNNAGPGEKAKTRLARALTLLSEKKFYTAILVYRQLIEQYPDWLLPYLGYSLALEKTGAFIGARQAVEQALKVAESGKDAKIQLKEKVKQLKTMSVSDQNNWRQQQTPAGILEKPTSFYLAFGGGQMIFGGSDGFQGAISGRFGIIYDFGNYGNLDFSSTLSLESAKGAGINISFATRAFTNDSFSVNMGALISYNGIGTDDSFPTVGASLGVSSYTSSLRDSSIDMLLTLPDLSSLFAEHFNPVITVYVGTAVYF